jgi:uncharacterized protein YaaW (UPF0174 family)
MMTSYYSLRMLSGLLENASDEDKLALTRVFDESAATAYPHGKLVTEISEAGGHSVVNVLRGEGVSYCEILHDIAESLKVKDVESLNELTATGLTIQEMDRRINKVGNVDVVWSWRNRIDAYVARHEQAIANCFFADCYKRMSAEQRIEIDRRVQEIASTLPDKGIATMAAPAAFLAVANAGGFATYMLMSSVISAATMGAAGFGVYTAASSVLHVVIGPVGWAALGIAAAYKLGAPNKQRCVRAAVGVALLRSKTFAPQ